MGHTIQFESHRGELAHIIDKLEHNRQVLEYYDQPPPIELNYISKSNRQVRTSHTPDFFVIEVNWVGWEEFKPISELIKKAQQQPNRYVQNEAGNWLCPPGEEYAQKYGLNYRLRTDIEQNVIRLRNYQWLEPYFQDEELDKNQSNNQRIVSIVKGSPGITYSELLLAITGISPDEINSLIAQEKLFIKRFSRLPQTIITDNGKEFHSVYFKQLLAYYWTLDKKGSSRIIYANKNLDIINSLSYFSN